MVGGLHSVVYTVCDHDGDDVDDDGGDSAAAAASTAAVVDRFIAH